MIQRSTPSGSARLGGRGASSPCSLALLAKVGYSGIMAKKKSNTTDDDSDASGPAKPYVVLARKYRPSTFDDLIGQSAMVTTLRNAFASGRIAQGYMLTGVRGVGKTTTARILARALNYEAPGYDKPTIDMPPGAAGLGVHCKDIMEGRHPDVLEIDAASHTGVDNIREIIESAQYMPLVARIKVFMIDEVHMLSKGAFNALLKTLEEPPAHVRFIFATTEIRKVPVTVLSRCQRFDLRRVEQPVLAEHFKKIVANEGARADSDALQLIARAAEGSVRDGLSVLDQAIAMGEGHVTAAKVRDMLGLADRARVFDLAESLFRGDVAAALEGLAGIASGRRRARRNRFGSGRSRARDCARQGRRGGTGWRGSDGGGKEALYGARRTSIDALSVTRLADAAQGIRRNGSRAEPTRCRRNAPDPPRLHGRPADA